MAAFLALQLSVPNYRNSHVQLSLDNTTAVAYLNHQGGTKSVQLSAIATEIWCWHLERNIHLSVVHIPGLKNLFADPLSRLKNLLMGWMLNRAVFHQIVAIYGLPDINLFASALNHQVKRYVSWIEDPRAQAIGAFSISWGGGGDQLVYAFPPFSLIQRCLQKVIQDRAQVLLVVPVWRSRPWYPILLDLLTNQPCLLPVDPLLVHLPWESLPHPLLNHHNFRLATWPLSGSLSSHRIYQKGCLKSYWLHGKKGLRNNMTQHGNNSVAGVIRNRLIRFLAI